MNQIPTLSEEEIKFRFQSMIRAEHATYAAFQRPRYMDLIRRIKKVKTNKLKKAGQDYRLLKRFEVESVDGQSRLIKRGTDRIFVCTDELFDIIQRTHLESKLKRESKMLQELAKTYANITRDQVKSFLHLCQCQLCARPKIQVAKKPKCDLDVVLEAEVARTCGTDEAFPNDDNFQTSIPSTSNDANLHVHAQNSVITNKSPGSTQKKRLRCSQTDVINNLKECEILIMNGCVSESENVNALANKPVVAKSSVLSTHKRAKLSVLENVEALKQCEVVVKEEDTRLDFNESFSAVSPEAIQFNHVNGHHSPSIGDVRNTLDETEEPLQFDNVGAYLQQLVECQRQLLYVESRRLEIEEVKLQVDQQVAASLLDIVNQLKQNNNKTLNSPH